MSIRAQKFREFAKALATLLGGYTVEDGGCHEGELYDYALRAADGTVLLLRDGDGKLSRYAEDRGKVIIQPQLPEHLQPFERMDLFGIKASKYRGLDLIAVEVRRRAETPLHQAFALASHDEKQFNRQSLLAVKAITDLVALTGGRMLTTPFGVQAELFSAAADDQPRWIIANGRRHLATSQIGFDIRVPADEAVAFGAKLQNFLQGRAWKAEKDSPSTQN